MKLRTIIKITAASCVMAQTMPAAFTDAVDNQDGTYTNWFGTFAPHNGPLAGQGWINHEEHGHLYINSFAHGLWIYDPNAHAAGLGLNGWIFTSENSFPSFFVGQGWALFIQGVQGPPATPRVFYSWAAKTNLYLPKGSTQNIVEVASRNDQFSTLVTAVSTAGLVDALSGDGPLTVFAPTNDAFALVPTEDLNALLANIDALTGVLTYHVVPGRLTSFDLGYVLDSALKGKTSSGFLQTLNGADLRIDVTPFGVMINGDSMVTEADIGVSNGIIHIIDRVLMPPRDIVDTAIDAGFSTLVAAVQAAGLEDTLRGDGPYTVFAPTEEAFAALGQETINNLLNDPVTLGNILLYHVAGAKVYSAEVAPGDVTMANGAVASLSVNSSGGLMINGANIVVTDVQAANGVIHVIDAVILPPSQ